MDIEHDMIRVHFCISETFGWIIHGTPPFTTSKRYNQGDCIDSKGKDVDSNYNLNRPTGFSTNTLHVIRAVI